MFETEGLIIPICKSFGNQSDLDLRKSLDTQRAIKDISGRNPREACYGEFLIIFPPSTLYFLKETKNERSRQSNNMKTNY